MKLFKRKSDRAAPMLIPSQHSQFTGFELPETVEPFEKELFDKLRYTVPVIDAAIMKIIRLTGGFRLICSDERYQGELDNFCENVPVGIKGKSLGTFIDCFLDSMLTYGSAAGEIVPDIEGKNIAGLWNGDISKIIISSGKDPFERRYAVKGNDGTLHNVRHPERIIYASLIGGNSILRGLPALSGILMRIYQCIGQNFDRAGNVRYAVTYKPEKDTGDFAHSRERAEMIAREWSDGMNSAKYGQVKDFVAVGDIDIKVIGAENKLFDTNVPVRQLLEQIVAKLSIPPFLLGLSWSSTERMSSQQADILTSELEYYRRLLNPVICEIGNSFLCSQGYNAVCSVEWVNINLQDESALAEARLKNAQAREIEMRLNNNN
ncbi:MAG: serine/threonine protein phosphatase [Ruminococcus sp.]|nr:serine/threonine protein phosphatase [Ruminococcus sp.]